MTDTYNRGRCPRCKRVCWGDPDLECSCGWSQHNDERVLCADCGDEIEDPDNGIEVNGVWLCLCCNAEREKEDDEAQRDEEADRRYEDLKCGL